MNVWSGWPQTWNSQWFLWTWKTQGILRELCATSGKNCNKQRVFSSSFKYLCKTAVDWVNRVTRNRDKVRVRWWPVILLELMWNDPWWRSLLHLLFVVITYEKVSLWLWKSLENSGNFFSYFVATLFFCGVYGYHWWIFAKLLSLVHRGTKTNWLGLGIKRSKVKVIGQRRTELNDVCGIPTVWFFM